LRMTKILSVEDSRFLRIAMERALARAGYKVVSAEDGLQAIELAGKERPNLILLDMLLPKMGGQEVLAALKKNPSTAGIGVVACTGLSQKNAARLKKDGVCAFLDKSSLELDKGSEKLLDAVAGILRETANGSSANSRCRDVRRPLLPDVGNHRRLPSVIVNRPHSRMP